MTRERLVGVVLCGGASARMGEDKARLVVAGRSLLATAIAVLEPLVDEVVLATGRAPRYPETGRAAVLDAPGEEGPLAGLAAALRHAAEGGPGAGSPGAGSPGAGSPRAAFPDAWVLALACDMPRASGAVLQRLLGRARERGLDACLLESDAGLEPLCGVYRASCLSPVERALAGGARRVVAFHGDVRVGTLRESELPPDRRGSAVNLNTREELAMERGRA